MRLFNSIKLSFKLPLVMFSLCLTSLLLMTYIALELSKGSLENLTEERLSSLLEGRASHLETFLENVEFNLTVQASNPSLLDAVFGFKGGWREFEDPQAYLQETWITNNPHEFGERDSLADAGDDNNFTRTHKRYHGFFRTLMENVGLYDVILIDTQGNVIYTVEKEGDFATNVLDGTAENPNLKAIFEAMMSEDNAEAGTQFFDFQMYEISDAPAAFFSSLIKSRNGRVAAVMIYQVGSEQINQVLQAPDGLGETGQTYLVGEDGSLRSDQVSPHDGRVLETRIDTAAVQAVLAGQSGSIVRETDQGLLHENYLPLSFHGHSWGLIAAQSQSEFLLPWLEMRQNLARNGLIALIVFTGIAIFLGLSVGRPLERIDHAMRRISASRFDTEVPASDRGDEIGSIAKTLEEFRTSLELAASTAAEARVKGTAFTESSAAMMILNTEGEIDYTNRQLVDFFKTERKNFSSRYAAFDPDALVGTSVGLLWDDPADFEAILSGTTELPLRKFMDTGALRLSVFVNAILGEEGEKAGYVVEWEDVTTFQMNDATINTIESHQVKAVFSLEGMFETANELFAQSLSEDIKAFAGQQISDLLTVREEPGRDILAEAAQGNTVAEKFLLRLSENQNALIEGVVSPVKDASGKTLRILLIGNDISQAQAAIEQAEQERLRMSQAQGEVVDALRKGLGQLADGVLTAEVTDSFDSDYEQLRSDFNLAAGNLCQAMLGVVSNADSIRSEATDISAAAEDLSHRTEKQAATLEETAAALDQITSSVRSAAEASDRTNTVVNSAKESAETSSLVVNEAVAAMGEIETSSEKITKIISVIDDIAFQTNLLALNAGVEAARAGEAGRGFAVVASEVRALAQRSSDAAHEINNLISASGQHVKRGAELVSQTGDELQKIIQSVGDISHHVGEIAVSAKEQASGLAEINTSVNELDKFTQQNAAMFEETTAASHALTQGAEALSSVVSRFETGNEVAEDTDPGMFRSGRPAEVTSGENDVPVPHPEPVRTVNRPVTEGSAAVDLNSIAAEPEDAPDGWEEF